jgi:hypothetical protein
MKGNIMAYPKSVLVGDRVRYESAAGTIRGEVIRIVQAKNANNDMINWIHIEYFNPKSPSKHSIAVLAETALKMMKFVVTFRDYEVQVARGEKQMAYC